jgi:hypothetical protein
MSKGAVKRHREIAGLQTNLRQLREVDEGSIDIDNAQGAAVVDKHKCGHSIAVPDSALF